MTTITIKQHPMTLQNVTDMLQHFRKNHGRLRLHIIPTPQGVCVISIAQNEIGDTMDLILDNSARGLTRYALQTLRNPNVKQKVTTDNVSDLLGITLLDDVVCDGVIL